jgi:D-arginine dehydrogenase
MATPRASATNYDVVIVGGGIAGASLGAEIAGKARVLLIEAESQCGYHSTGRSAAFWLESYGGAKVALLTAASRQFLAEPPPEFADSGFLRTRGAIQISKSKWPEVPPMVESRRIDRDELERRIPGIRPEWRFALVEPGCASIDVGGLHAAYMRILRHCGGVIRTDARLSSGRRSADGWIVELEGGSSVTCTTIVNAAGAWADEVAERCGVQRLGIEPKRRTMVQLRLGRSGLRDLPQVGDDEGTFYFIGESDRSIWLSPHDEIVTDPCDAAPEEIDVAIAIDRFQEVVDWPVEAVERSWAGLRTFAPDRLPVYGFDVREPGFFWCAGQGGFGIQTAPAASKMAAAVLLGEAPKPGIDPAIFSPARFEV